MTGRPTKTTAHFTGSASKPPYAETSNACALMCAQSSRNKDEPYVGQIFTPRVWATWLLEYHNVFEEWQKGASVCDPTAGQGVFALALLDIAKKAGVQVTPEALNRVHLIELNPNNLIALQQQVHEEFQVKIPNIFVQDIITTRHLHQYDILVGNPPWATFANLPNKDQLKPYFVAEGLVHNNKDMLLGSSRIDIAALVLQATLGKLLKPKGRGFFFIPLSLFFGSMAHEGFRQFQANHRLFSIEEVHEFNQTKVFSKVHTCYGCASFYMDRPQKFPVTYFRENQNAWIKLEAKPLDSASSQWLVSDNKEPVKMQVVPLNNCQKPRQGANTCGANSVFIFDQQPQELPKEFLYPLVSKDSWTNSEGRVPKKWILLPYDKNTGKPLTWEDLENEPHLRDYLLKNKDKLAQRKGTMIRASIAKGVWWSLLGVGLYSFTPFKVLWQAYGQRTFNPTIFEPYDSQPWQGNQALHAYVPCESQENAVQVLNGLQQPAIQTLLEQLGGAGKCNWAQPGKITKILSLI
jgi:methylase of polypeptide subunit release factors